ncbi:ABC transporter ATP-binding protein [Falsiphaeobacter marinintestinus]|uniref:ABC transporter ATP-binding protein n=1 Tax=Falsiphaeobacter marinintestinus TaxID=1492905 RepID=UPI0011B72AA8|nr:ABC transporter ATP-binding protein [Phaeobacter marinintestinus]
MMTIAHLLQDFSKTAVGSGPFRFHSEETLEDLRLSSFEQGYAAGWEDAAKARSSEDTNSTRAISNSLEDLSFTFHEVRAQMFALLEPLFDCVTESVLPNIAAKGTRRQIVGLLTAAASDLVEHRATLFVPQGGESRLAELMGQPLPMPLTLVEDPCLTGDQIILRLGSAETAMDATMLVRSINDLIDAFLFDVQEDAKHG